METDEISSAPRPDPPHRTLGGHYALEGELGRGGMAVVYAGRDLRTGAAVAVKLIHPELSEAVGAARFRQEIRIASSLTHPHILPVLDSGAADGQLYLVMPLVTGESLAARVTREGQLPVDEAVRLTREVAAALEYAHARGVVHRDLKPENILLGAEGGALLADFGVARASSDLRATQALTGTGVSVGTPTYMSPEQATADRTLDGRSDQYSLACVLYEMLAGQAPFTAKTAQALIARHLLEPVPPIAVVRGTVPRQVESALLRALAKAPADRFPSVAAFAEALGTPESWATGPAVRVRAPTAPLARRAARWLARPRVVAALATLAVAGVAAGVWLGRRPAPAGPAITVAVAPFNPLRPEYALWQEGIVDVLARALDGAGPVRTVAPAVAIRGWNGRKADRASARALAVRTGARYAVFGSVTSAPGGAVQLRGALLDARTDSLWEQAWVGLDVKPLADSATTFVLGRLGERHPIGAVRRVAFASTSPEALKPFLQGEQLFRRTAWGPARQAYARAAALDTAFALPLRRIGQIIGYEHDNADSVGRAYALRAGALNRGLGARDSLLVSIDSLFAALSQREGTSTDWAGLQRLFATANLTARRYPDDPEVWFTLGEVREHLGYGSVADVSDEDVFAAFERAIALDPGFAPAYIHAVGLAFKLRGRTTGRTYNSAYLSLTPVGGAAEAAFVVERVTDPARAASPETRRVLDSVPTSVLRNALLTLRRWPDSAETALTLVRAIARRPATAASHPTDSAMVQSYLPLTLAYRGRFNEAFEALGSRRSRLFSELVLLGGVPRDTAEAVFARWLADGSPHARFALPYWAEQGNVSALHRFRARADTALRAAKPTTYAGLTHDVRAADAYLALAQRDTGRAVTAFAQLSDTLCLGCYLDRLTYARLLRTRGRLEEADRLLRQRLYTVLTPSEVWISAERARVAQQRRDRATARSAYEFVSEAWSRGDPEVQPVLREAREALRNLGTRNDSIVAAATRPE